MNTTCFKISPTVVYQPGLRVNYNFGIHILFNVDWKWYGHAGVAINKRRSTNTKTSTNVNNKVDHEDPSSTLEFRYNYENLPVEVVRNGTDNLQYRYDEN